jgi:predicted HTH domain antitoxin
MAKLPGSARKICVDCEHAQKRLPGANAFEREVSAMATTVRIPDQIARLLRLNGLQGERRVLEILAADGYRSGDLSREAVGELLGLQPDETMRFLKRRRCTPGISLEGYDDISDALKDFTAALVRRSRARNKRKQ